MLLLLMAGPVYAQDSTIALDNQAFTLSEVVVRNNFDYKAVLATIKQDTTFYKAFRNLRIIGFSSYNSIQMLGKDGAVKASLNSKTRQNHIGNCRTMDVLEEQTTGDFYSATGKYNYLTPELYASLFFTKGKICGENNSNDQLESAHAESIKAISASLISHEELLPLYNAKEKFNNTYLENEAMRRRADSRTALLSQALDYSERGIEHWQQLIDKGLDRLLVNAKRVREGEFSTPAISKMNKIKTSENLNGGDI